ncbi:MAG: prepilin peptidase [Rhodospirillales bacterium]|nr:prepilin peptidase [Rhodospirillales bacterium]
MDILTTGAACGLFAASVMYDQRRRRIPNMVPLALAVLFAVSAFLGTLPSGWLEHVAVGGAFLAAGFLFYLAGGFGAGDGKLLAAAGLWVGPAMLGWFLLAMAGCALALSLVGALRGGRFLRRGLPFAWAIAPPAIFVLLARAGLSVW